MSKWFIEHRQEFIRDHIKVFGQIRRADLSAQFSISSQQASVDIALFIERNPDAIVYDGRSKAYVIREEPLLSRPGWMPIKHAPKDGSLQVINSSDQPYGWDTAYHSREATGPNRIIFTGWWQDGVHMDPQPTMYFPVRNLRTPK